PVGRYFVQVFDTQAGWLNDIRSSSNGEYEKIFKTVDHMFKDVDLDRPVYDSESGTYTFAQYNAQRGSLTIESGKFATVDVRRNLKAIARGSDWFNKEAAERFMPGQFYRFLWSGTKYSFSADQARVVDVLLRAHAHDQSDMSETDVLTQAFHDEASRPQNLASVFNDAKHPAWGIVFSAIDSGEMTRFQLKPLETAQR
ncbi:MAG: hypothetical protein KDA91_24940, partial [Planctomycetaceae bacterium]|nr:hypothetical protein [Planctomycetaceae bacterium]